MALVAVAWEIVEKLLVNGWDENLEFAARKRIATNAFIDVYQAILNAKRIGETDDALFEGPLLFSNDADNERPS